jgi:predicted DNA-binding transcriptional regulator YafY
MDQTGRLYKIDQLLRQHKVISFAALQAELGVSRATLKRDLDDLRTRLQLPIEWSRAAGGYRLASTGEVPTSAHELPGLWFSSTEIHALLTMQQLLSHLECTFDQRGCRVAGTAATGEGGRVGARNRYSTLFRANWLGVGAA